MLLHTFTLKDMCDDCQVNFLVLFNCCALSLAKLHSKLNVKISFSLKYLLLGTVHNKTMYPSLNSWFDSHCVRPDSERNRDDNDADSRSGGCNVKQ